MYARHDLHFEEEQGQLTAHREAYQSTEMNILHV